MDKLRETLVEMMSSYAVQGFNVRGYLTWNEDKTVFAVVDVVSEKDGRRYADASLIVRLVRDWILIERDINTPTLMESLVETGIPRQRIVCVYAGETLTDDDIFKDLLRREIEGYAAHHSGYFTVNEPENLFIVTRHTNGTRKVSAETDIIARFSEGKVVIEHARDSQALINQLAAAGIPRERIVVTAETVPEPAAK